MKIIGSRRGKPLLPLWLQWVAFVLSSLVSLVTVIAWVRGDVDSYHYEHVRMALLSSGVTLMAAAGLIRQNRKMHVALFVGGGSLVILAASLR
jgi:hypothetical protein